MKFPAIENNVSENDKIQKDVRSHIDKRSCHYSTELREKKDHSSAADQTEWSQECSGIYPYCLIETLQKERNGLFLKNSSESKNITRKSKSAVNSLIPFSLTEIQNRIVHRQITRVKELEERIHMDEKRRFKVSGKWHPK